MLSKTSASPLSQNNPRVSVVVPSYNHARYLPAALESVARQTFTDYEINILDDASSDDSLEQIKAFIAGHPELRCRFQCNPRNQGGVITLNHLVQEAQGEYLALINSDDLWQPDKLAQQVAYLDEHPEVGAVFTQASIITDYGSPLVDGIGFPSDIFLQENRSRGKWLRHFFFELNCLCHPSLLIRRSVYDQVGLYDPRLRQLPDFEMWVRLVKHTSIAIIEKPLVSLRFHRENTSKVNVKTITRNLNETSFILARFFDDIPPEVFVEGFGDLFRQPGLDHPLALACEQAFMYFQPGAPIKTLYQHAGLHRLYQLLGQPETRDLLRDAYKLDYEAFFAMSGTHFFDDALIAYRRGSELDGYTEGSWLDGLRYLLRLNMDFFQMQIRNTPALYVPLRKVWRRLKGKRN